MAQQQEFPDPLLGGFPSTQSSPNDFQSTCADMDVKVLGSRRSLTASHPGVIYPPMISRLWPVARIMQRRHGLWGPRGNAWLCPPPKGESLGATQEGSVVLCKIPPHQQGLTLNSGQSHSYHFALQETTLLIHLFSLQLGALGLKPILFPSWDLVLHLCSEGFVPLSS